MNRLLIVSLILLGNLLPTTAAAQGVTKKDDVRVVGGYDPVEGCERIGEVKGSTSWGGENTAYKHMKRNAFEQGADTVVVLSDSPGWSGPRYRGECFLCTPERSITLKSLLTVKMPKSGEPPTIRVQTLNDHRLHNAVLTLSRFERQGKKAITLAKVQIFDAEVRFSGGKNTIEFRVGADTVKVNMDRILP